jgi:hypothetical protein
MVLIGAALTKLFLNIINYPRNPLFVIVIAALLFVVAGISTVYGVIFLMGS